ncbi:MAG TPA: hypothetical protein VE997_02170 [Candidatus Limnocylindria bacterium]|nr:hypothetical protein [Candidatus Limnocylindria bacterium]
MSTDTEDVSREDAPEARGTLPRAERVFRNVGETVSSALARAREETEDIWAEARDISRGRFGRGRREGS